MCGLSSWLPGLIPDLSVIPNIPGITVPCDSDAGATTNRDAGARDAGPTVDAGKQDAGVPAAGDAGRDGGRDASTDSEAMDASSDAAAQDGARDAAADAADGKDAWDADSVDPASDAATPDATYIPVI